MVVAFWVVPIPVAGPVQWLLLFVCSVVSTFVLYELVRRVGVLRFLFGMKQRRRDPVGCDLRLRPGRTMMPSDFELDFEVGDITRQEGFDAIVNAANAQLSPVGESRGRSIGPPVQELERRAGPSRRYALDRR